MIHVISGTLTALIDPESRVEFRAQVNESNSIRIKLFFSIVKLSKCEHFEASYHITMRAAERFGLSSLA